MPDPDSSPLILVMVSDLIFSTKIIGTARSLDIDAKIIRKSAQLLDQPGRLLIVDLNQPDAIASAAGWRNKFAGRVIGFVSHVDTQIISDAKTAGLDEILPRSRFVQDLPRILGS